MLDIFDLRNPIPWLIGAVALGVAGLWLRGRFTAERRELRRREKSHRPVISRRRGPSVRFAVNTGKPKGDRKD